MMEADKKKKDCYIPFLCDIEDCCVCESRSLHSKPIELMSEDTACDLAIEMWKSGQLVKQSSEQIDESNKQNGGEEC